MILLLKHLCVVLIIKPVNKSHLTNTKKQMQTHFSTSGSFLLHVTRKDSIIMQACSQTYHIPSFTQLFSDHVTLFESFLPLAIQELEDAFPFLQGLPGLVLLLLGWSAFLLPCRHDSPESLHHLVVSHPDSLPQILLAHFLFCQPAVVNAMLRLAAYLSERVPTLSACLYPHLSSSCLRDLL